MPACHHVADGCAADLNRRTSDSSITTYLKADDGWRTPTTPDSKSLNGFELDDNLNSPKWKTVVQSEYLERDER